MGLHRLTLRMMTGMLYEASKMSYGIEILDATPEWLDIPFISIYLVYGEGDRDLLVDVGPRSSSTKVLKLLSGRGYESLDYYITHIHLDHVGALGEVHRSLEGNVYLHPRAVKHVADPTRLWETALASLGGFAEMYGEPLPVSKDFLVGVEDGYVLDEYGLKLIHTPGHASHHISAYHEESRGMFVGDSAGIYVEELDYVIPTTIYPTRLDSYIESLEKMLSYRPSLLYYSHYGIAEDGVDKLSRLLKTLETWISAARDLGSEDEYRDYITSGDEEFRRIYARLEEIPLAKTLVDLAIKGVYEWVRERG